MGFFGTDAREMVRSRSNFVRELSKKFNAEYYYGVNSIRKRNFFFDNNAELNDSNVFVGNIDGYDYCFVEHYHRKCGRNDSNRWMSSVTVKLKNYMPDFCLMTKSDCNSQLIFMSCFAIMFIGVPTLFLFFYFIFAGLNFAFLFIVLFSSVFYIIGFFVLNEAKKLRQKKDSQGMYGISNLKFKEKYTIITEVEPQIIRRIFNDEFCSEIANNSKDICIEVKKNCVTNYFDRYEQLSFDLCNKYLKDLIEKVKIFEKAPSL